MNQSEILVNILLGRPLSCKLKGRPFVVVVVRLRPRIFTDVLWLNGAKQSIGCY